jgi:hypothetical protein
MERIDERTQSLTTLLVTFCLSANETKARAYSPTRPRPASRSNRPDTYERLLLSLHALTCETQPVHTKRVESSQRRTAPSGASCPFSSRRLTSAFHPRTTLVKVNSDPLRRWGTAMLGPKADLSGLVALRP